jgi:uracil phosphoribosyltransferase
MYIATLSASSIGIRNILAKFPGINIISTWLEESLDTKQFLYPGLGYIGDRYFNAK